MIPACKMGYITGVDPWAWGSKYFIIGSKHAHFLLQRERETVSLSFKTFH